MILKQLKSLIVKDLINKFPIKDMVSLEWRPFKDLAEDLNIYSFPDVREDVLLYSLKKYCFYYIEEQFGDSEFLFMDIEDFDFLFDSILDELDLEDGEDFMENGRSSLLFLNECGKIYSRLENCYRFYQKFKG